MAKKKRRTWLIILLVAIVLALIAYAYWKGQSKPKGEEVTTEKVTKRTIKETVSASGRVFPETEVRISSDVSGEIVQLYVEEGDSVRLGQVLAKIDPEAYLSSVERGEASLNNSKAQLAMSQSQIENSRANLKQIQSQVDNARKNHERNIKLLADGVISQIEFDQTLATLEGVEANYSAAEAALQSASESSRGSEFTVKSSEAQLRELRTNLGRTTIKAPTNGVVSSLSVEQGERVVGTAQMSGTEMMRIANLNTMEVQVEVSENDILKVALNDQVDIEVDAYVDRIFTGHVSEIANSATNAATGASLNTDQVTNFIVKILMAQDSYKDLMGAASGHPFRPGMSASVDIYTDVEEEVISVPIQAVTIRDMNKIDAEEGAPSKEEDLQEVVFIYAQDTARMVSVSTGIQDDEHIKINTGLEVDDEIITGPYSAISKKIEVGSELRKKEEKEKSE